MRKVQETKHGLKVNDPHQLPVSADDVNVMGEYIYIIQKNTEALSDAGKKFV
jgi:hypothetical protein